MGGRGGHSCYCPHTKYDGKVKFSVRLSVHQGGGGNPAPWSMVPGPFLEVPMVSGSMSFPWSWQGGGWYPSQVLSQEYPSPRSSLSRTRTEVSPSFPSKAQNRGAPPPPLHPLARTRIGVAPSPAASPPPPGQEVRESGLVAK